MRFDKQGDQRDIQDRRGARRAIVGGGLGLGGLALVIVFALATGQDPLSLLGAVAGPDPMGPAQDGTGAAPPSDPATEALVRDATTDIQDFWTEALPQQVPGTPYERIQLVLFTDQTTSACGSASAQTGPFYCPGDHLAYVDLGFFDELGQRLGAPGQFAQAYVLAHEFGHHLQGTLGIERAVRVAQTRDPSQENALSVALELQADCFAGVWGASAVRRGMLDAGEAQQAIVAAGAIGDDRLQRMAGRAVSPESFTHGSSAQRVQWFSRGMERGDVTACDTFGNGTLRP